MILPSAPPLSPKQASLLRPSKISGESSHRRLTPFQITVYTALCRVPTGCVTTYQHLARSVNCGSSQAVGQALRRNPHAPVIPCHRVVATDRSLGGFGGCRTGAKLDQKRRMLEKEGVRFDARGRVEADCIFDFTTLN